MEMADEHKEAGIWNMTFLGTDKHMKRGLSAFRKKDYQRAIEHFELIVLHDKNYFRAYNNLGYVYRTIGNYDKALEVWKKGLRINPSYRRLQKNVRSLQQALESKDKSLETRAIEIEDFEAELEWLSENAELAEIREGRFFDAYIIEDDGFRWVLKTLRKPLSANEEMMRAF